jgi:TPR repeat protein
MLGRRLSIAAIVLAGIAAVSAVTGLAFSFTTRQSVAAAQPTRLSGAPAEAGFTGGWGTGGSFADMFAIATVSPKGRARKGVDLETGLGLADQYLSANGAAERVEGEYWLKHSLSLALGDERIRWALTQLGSGYAAGTSGAPDYAKARLLWEIAGQLGDPIALCFLGTIYERGLGVATDKGQALTWYARAKQAGGCPGGDAALARTGQ